MKCPLALFGALLEMCHFVAITASPGPTPIGQDDQVVEQHEFPSWIWQPGMIAALLNSGGLVGLVHAVQDGVVHLRVPKEEGSPA